MQESCELLLQLIDYHQMTIIVIDALDECDPNTHDELLQVLQTVLSQSTSLVKIFVSSRDDGDIKRQLEEYPDLTISSSKNFSDITAFITFETAKIVRRRKLLRNSQAEEELQSSIVQEAIDKADGM